MMKGLLWRGMLAGLVGGLAAALFALVVAEPSIDAAIGLEARHAMAGMAEAPLVARSIQKTFGLFTAMALYGVALGGLFAIAFAAACGRVARLGPRGLALALGVAAFLLVALVPALRYPPNPPAVGLHETVRLRTAAYFAMLALSLGGAAASWWTFRAARLGAADRALATIALYVVVVAAVSTLLPAIDEMPADFPATLLWRFRIAAIATQGVFWLVAADLFGRMAARLLPRAVRT